MKLWLAVASEDVAEAQAVYAEYWSQGIPADVRALSEKAVDLDAERTQCPACGEEFAPEETVRDGGLWCPGCGLRYA